MLEFDYATKVLRAYKNKCAIPDIHKIPSLNKIIYENAVKYYNNPDGLRKDVVELWFPEFKKMLNIPENDNDTLWIQGIRIKQEDAREYFKEKMERDPSLDRIDYHTEAHKRGSKIDHYSKYVVLVRFGMRGFDNSVAEYVPVLHIPWVREDGIIEYNGAEYSFIHALEQTDGISYSQNAGTNNPAAITLRTNRNVLNIINNPKTGLILSMDKKKHEMINVVSAMLRREGYLNQDALDSVWNDFADSEIINLYTPGTEKFMQKWYYSIGNSRGPSTDYYEKIAPILRCTPLDSKNFTNDRFNTAKLRDTLNEILSLDQAIDSVLAKPIINKDGIVLQPAGVVVTSAVVDQCKRNGIYKIYVECPVDVTGAICAEDIYVGKIPVGTLVTDKIEMAFPEETGMYTVKDHLYKDHINDSIADIFTIEKGHTLTKEDIDLIRSSGRDYVLIQAGKVVKKINFYTEVISNRQFRGEWIGKESGKWYYQNVIGEYCEPDGFGYTAYDFIALWSYAVKAFRGQTRMKLPNIDEDFRKLLIPINEQFHRAMSYCVKKGMAQMKQTFSIAWRGSQKEYFLHADSPLIEKFYAYERLFWQYLVKESKCVKQIPASALNNPIAYISEVTKASVFVSSSHAISKSQRMIAIGSYGKIDPYECPQSHKIGIVNNLSTYTNIDSEGNISTPYLKVYHKGNQSYINIDDKYTYLTVEEEEHVITADICSINIDLDGRFLDSNETLVLCRIPMKNGKDRMAFEKCRIADIDYVNANAIQPLSWASSTIPFLCNNDAARAVFAVAQMKQAKGLVSPEEPIVRTSTYKMIPRLNSKFGYVANRKMYVYSSQRDKRTGYWNVMTADGKYDIHDMSRDFRDIPAPQIIDQVDYPEFRTGDNSVMTIHPIVMPRDSIMDDTPEVYEGETVLSTNFVSDNGVMQFGRNAFVLFIPDGFDYEDSIHISEKFAHDMTSYRINEELLTIRPTTRMPRLKGTEEHPLHYCTREFRPGTDNDTVLISYKDGLSDKRVIEKKLHSAYGHYIGEYAHQNENGLYDGVVIQLLSQDSVTNGDKMSNRHGNKCTTAEVDNLGMPTINNGVRVDAVMNPLGVGSRMNIGQIKEGHNGLIGKVLGIKIESDAYNGITDEETATLLSLIYEIANNVTNWRNISNSVKYPDDLDTLLAQPRYKIIPESLKQHCRENFDKIQVWQNTFDERGAFDYYYWDEIVTDYDEDGDPIYKKTLCKSKCFGGYIYMFKLTQESHKKVHSRANDMSDEEYSKMTDAPTHGASRGGGQRMGTMEIDALCAYGVDNYIKELMNERSDNAIARANFNCKTYFDPKIVAPYINSFKGQRRSVTQLLYLLLCLGVMTTSDDGEILPISNKNNVELAHLRSGYLQRELCRFSPEDSASEDDENVENTPESVVKEEVIDSIFNNMKFKKQEE